MPIYKIYNRTTGKLVAEYDNNINAGGRLSIIDNEKMEQKAVFTKTAKKVMDFLMKQYISGGYADNQELMNRLSISKPSTLSNSITKINNTIDNTEIEGLISHGNHSLNPNFRVEISDFSGTKLDESIWKNMIVYEQSIKDDKNNIVISGDSNGEQDGIEPIKKLPMDFMDYITDTIKPVKHILLYGNGGMGKTYLLSRIKLTLFDADYYFIHVYYVSLSELLNKAMNDTISDKDHKSPLDRASVDNNYIFRYFGISNFHRESTYLFMLDGYNEMMDRKTSQNFSIIEQLQEEIACLNAEKLTVIVTTRNKTDKKYFSDDYRLLTLSELEVKLPELNFSCDISNEAKKEILDMLKRPLFYSQFTKRKKTDLSGINNKFDLFLYFHSSAFHQACEIKNTTDKSPYLILYYILAPVLAYEIDRTRSDQIDETEAHSIIEQWLERRTEIVKLLQIITGKELNQISISDSPSFYWDMLKEFDFGTLDRDVFRFNHQEWGDYFAAFYIVYSLKCINNITLEMLPTFNLKSSTQNYVMNAFGIEKTNDKKISEQHRENFKKIFYVEFPDNFFQKISVTKIKLWISRLYAAYALNDHFMLRYLKQREEITKPFCDALKEHPEVLDKSKLGTSYMNALVEIYTGVIQYYRIDNEYEKCREYYEFAEKNLFYDGIDAMQKKALMHHKGKALIFSAQYYYTRGEMPKSLWCDDMDAKKMFNEGIAILENCLPYNMSANLLGAIYSTPTKWILENGLIKRDVVKAYDIYNKAYQHIAKNIFLPEGTELIYTARQLAGLLLKGYVHLENGSAIASDKETIMPNIETLEYAKEILSHTMGQDYYLVGWLRGIFHVYEGFVSKKNTHEMNIIFKEIAIDFFIKDNNFPLTLLVYLIQYWDSSLSPFRNKFKKITGYIDEKALKNTLYNVWNDSNQPIGIDRIGSQAICESADAIYHFYDVVNLLINNLKN